jgi:hypothetical protein
VCSRGKFHVRSFLALLAWIPPDLPTRTVWISRPDTTDQTVETLSFSASSQHRLTSSTASQEIKRGRAGATGCPSEWKRPRALTMESS